MHWIYLAVAIVFEIGFAVGTKATHGFTRLWPSLFTLAASASAIFFLSLALKTLDLSTGYMIWTGLGSVGTVTVGVMFYKERINATRAASFAMIILGVIGLRIASGV